ncbi:alpha/beta hydrolase [Arthrobacter sp. RIT-PI-e]|nr:alpha/beta hydrolase [Arthrobacter sp. RIT-PI-e]
MWEPAETALGQLTDRTVVSLDLPGHGSEPALTAPVSLEDLAEDVAGRLPGRSHIVGFSLGALIAQHLAVHRPDLVASLASVSSVCRRTPEESMQVRRRLDAARSDFRGSVEASITRWYPEGQGVDRHRIEQTRATLLANPVESYLHAYEVFATADTEIGTELHRIRVPSLAVTGEFDPGSTPEMTRRLEAAIPGTRAVVVPGARHMLPVEQPDELARIIHHFITEPNREDHG